MAIELPVPEPDAEAGREVVRKVVAVLVPSMGSTDSMLLMFDVAGVEEEEEWEGIS